MMKNDKQMLDMLRNEFEKSSESAKVPLRLQKESMVAMLKKEVNNENRENVSRTEKVTHKEADFSDKTGTKKSKIIELRKYSAIAAMFAFVTLGAFTMSTNTATIAMAQRDNFFSKTKEAVGELLENPEDFKEVEKIIYADSEDNKNNDKRQSHQSDGSQKNPSEGGKDDKKPSFSIQEILAEFFSGYQSVDPNEKVNNGTAETPAVATPEVVAPGVIAPGIVSPEVIAPQGNSPSVNTPENKKEETVSHHIVEADTVKSVGNKLYVLTTAVDSETGNITEKIEVVKKVDSENAMESVSHITLCENVVSGAYEECRAVQIYGDILIAILERKDFDTETKTIAKYYNINKPEEPVRIHVQDGKYLYSSVNGNNLLLFTDKGAHGSDYSVRPVFSVDGKETALDAQTDIFKPAAETIIDSSYYFITVTDVTDFEKPVGYFAAVGIGKQFNCFENAIVVTREWATTSENETKGSLTEFYRFNIEGTTVNPPVTVAVEGSVVSGVYVNPENEDLMFVTSLANEDRFYSVDKNMKSSPRYVKLPEGKKVDAVRFIGKKAYLTSGNETMVINTSLSLVNDISGIIPAKLIMGSVYGIADSKLLDIYTDENGAMTFRLFDVSDPENPSVATDYVLDVKYNVISPLESKNVLIIPEKELFGIPAVVDDPDAGAEYSAYLIFSVANEKIELVGICRHNEFYVSDAAVNAVYDNGVIYTVSGEKISAFSADTFERISKHEIK